MPFVQSNGIRIHYDEVGQGPPLLLIMGLGADATLWKQHVEEYQKYFRCLLMDNRGAGQTDAPEGPYTTKMMADDCAGLLDALKIDPAHICGISMGAAVSQWLSIVHPRKVRSQILVSAWPYCDEYTRTIFEHFMEIRPSVSPAEFTKLLQLWIFAPTFFENGVNELRTSREDSTEGFYMANHAYSAQCLACIEHDTRSSLKKIKIPTLITVGNADIFTPLHLSEYLKSHIADSEMLVFPGCGHAHHWEQVNVFNSRTTKFLMNH